MEKEVNPDDILFTTDDIIDSTTDNSAGTILDYDAINCVVEKILKAGKIDFSTIDNLIADNESLDGGYLVKTSDFINAIQTRFEIIKKRS